MDSITFTPARPRTKSCPFCAETIQAAAIKCRFCGEFLNTDRAKALGRSADVDSQSNEDERQAERILFEGRPSLFGMAGAVMRGLFFLGVAGFLVYYPLENLPIFQAAGKPVPVEYSENIKSRH